MAVERFPSPSTSRRCGRLTVVSVWFGALIGAVLIGAYSVPGQRVKWIVLTMTACTVLALVLQLGLVPKRGFVDRVSTSVAGALVVLAGATLIFWLSAPGAAVVPGLE